MTTNEQRMAELIAKADAKPEILHVNGSDAVLRTGDFRIVVSAWSGNVRPFVAYVTKVSGGVEERVGRGGWSSSISGAVQSGMRIAAAAKTSNGQS